jgi:hypothetical protein
MMNPGDLDMEEDVSYGTANFERGIGVTGFASDVFRHNRRITTQQHVHISARGQTNRVIEVSQEVEAIPMIRQFFIQHIAVPIIMNADRTIRSTLNEFLVEIIQNIIVIGHAAIAFDKISGMPRVIPANEYTAFSRIEYEERFCEPPEALPEWRKNSMNETHTVVFDNEITQEKYWNTEIGGPVLISGNYGVIKNGYPSSPLAELAKITDFNRIMSRSNSAAAIKSVQSQAFLISGMTVNPKVLVGQQQRNIGDVIRERNTVRDSLILSQMQKNKKADDNMMLNLMRTNIKSVQETQMMQFRPYSVLNASRVSMYMLTVEAVARAYGIDPTALHLPSSAVRSAHINLKDAEERLNAILQVYEPVKYAIDVWKECIKHVDCTYPKQFVEDIEMKPPIAVDVLIPLLDRLKPAAVSRLFSSMVPIEVDEIIEADEGKGVPSSQSHAKNPALP